MKEFEVDLINRLENALKQMQKHFPVEPNEAYQELQTTIDYIGRDDHEDTPPSKKFKADVIERPQNVLKQMPIEVNGTYQDLWEITEHRRRKDLESPWPRQFKKDEILLNSWPDYFLFLALMASTRALGNPQGVTLIDSTTFKVSALAYNGFPRGVRSDMQNDSMQVSALTNAICLRSSEGHDFYAFSTHFPSLQDAKNLAQAKIERLYFIWPKSLEGNKKKALEILQKAGMEVVPMHVPDLAKLKQGIEKTIKGLQEAEKKNPEFPFSDWPSYSSSDYELQPKQVSQSGNAQQ